MSVFVLDPGVQTTLQASARVGLRQAGVPASGPADPVSMALANRLVGKPAAATCLEITLGPASFRFDSPMQIGLTGARASVQIAGVEQQFHETISVKAGDALEIGAARAGARIYLAVSGDLPAEVFLNSASTYLPAGFGGLEGRALRKGDRLEPGAVGERPFCETPHTLRLPVSASYALRAVAGPDWNSEDETPASSVYRVTTRLSRMGAEIDGVFPAVSQAGMKPSSAVFPGALQVTPQGRGFLLLPDGQTTGGYPHVLQVIRADRHLLGQIRPGDSLRFLMCTQVQAEAALRAKQALLVAWMPDFSL
ncbi:MAG: biotin-dependent carboxyltransferase family protein [Hyphomonas sp.]